MADSNPPYREEEEEENLDDATPPPASEEEGEDLDANAEQDYQDINELDTYEADGLDEQTYEHMDAQQRLAADRELEERDRRLGRARRGIVPQALMSREEEDDFALPISRRPLDYAQTGEEADVEAEVNLEDFQGPLRDWLDETRVRRTIKKRFRKFLDTWTDPTGNLVYPARVAKMGAENGCSLDVHYMELSQAYAVLAVWCADCPQIMLELFDEVALEATRAQFPEYHKIHPHIHVRVSHLPLNDLLRDLRQLHLNAFIQVGGVVTRRTNIFPQLQLCKFDCLKCGFVIGPFAQKGDTEIRPPSCPDCQSNGPFRLNEAETIYRNYQKICLQESPGSVPAGRIPRSRDVILVDDLCDMVRPGEQIRVTGVYKNIFEPGMNAQNGFPVFATVIEANYITKERDYFAQYVITDEDRKNIIALSKRPDVEKIIVNSIAPSIYGHEYIKRGIAYSLFGGQEKRHQNKHRVRGDINILILGDPGVAKSQFLKYVENVAFRAVYATGKGASAVGLTASVRRDPVSREWTLEGGALVLADRGVCLIDEFDKMNDQDRTSIHEAMEQQSISISKAGIVASLQARCAVIAAANPLRGRYDGSLTFVENVDLGDPILSRFDILAVVRDKVDPVIDEMLADFVVKNHMNSHPASQPIEEKKEETFETILNDKQQVSQETLRKYILHAKNTCHPKLNNIDRDKISKFYADLRQKSMEGGGIPIAVRHVESILRISEARAKLHLREYVRDDDVDMAIRVMLESFIDTQKQSVQSSLKRHFKNYLTYQKESTELLIHILENEVKDELSWRQLRGDEEEINNIEIPLDVFEQKAEEVQASELQGFYNGTRFRDEGFTVDSKRKLIIKHLR